MDQKLIKSAKKLATLTVHKDFRRGLRKGVAAGTEHLDFLRSVSPRTIVDVGANKGQFSLCAIVTHPGARILAFEPLPGPANIFRQLFAEHDDVRMHELAIGRAEKAATIHVSAREDSSSLLAIGPEQVRNFPGTHSVREASIRVASLKNAVDPSLLSPPCLLKIDVQGYEGEVLHGAADLLEMFRWIYVELSFVRLYTNQPVASDIIAYLAEKNFQLNGVFNLSYSQTGMPIQGDFAFEQIHAKNSA